MFLPSCKLGVVFRETDCGFLFPRRIDTDPGGAACSQGISGFNQFIQADYKIHFLIHFTYLFFSSYIERTHQDCSGDCAIFGEKEKLLASNC